MVKYKYIIKAIDEEVKCRTTGTNFTNQLRKSLTDFTEEYGNEPVEHLAIYDREGNLVIDKVQEGDWHSVSLDEKETQKLIEENKTDLHKIHNHPTDEVTDPLPTCFSYNDYKSSLIKNSEDEYIFRSTTCVSSNGSSMTLTKSNDFPTGKYKIFSEEEAMIHGMNYISRQHTSYLEMYKNNYIMNARKETGKIEGYENMDYFERESIIKSPEFRKKVHENTLKDIGGMDEYFRKNKVTEELDKYGLRLEMQPPDNNKIQWDNHIFITNEAKI